MEMIGLAIIVILLALGIFFVSRFTLTKEEPTQAQTFQLKQLGASFVNTLLATNAGCTGTSTYADLIVEMADPLGSILVCPDDLDQHFNITVSNMLNKTLNLWNYNYQLQLIYPPNAPTTQKELTVAKGCLPISQSEAYTQPIPTSDYGTILVRMKICY